MLNFTVGPVEMSEATKEIGHQSIPYFRTTEFSYIMKENEQYMKTLVHAQEDARTLFLTASGTGAMEASVMNVLSSEDHALVVNGGSFGGRFVELCKLHKIPYTEVKLSCGESLIRSHLEHCKADFTALLINMHETSTGVLYDMEMVSEFCKEHNLILIVDAISAFLADSIEMKKWRADVIITGSQKALACPPGVSIMVLSKRGVERVSAHAVDSLYFDLKKALWDGERGQTPFTPAVGILLQIHARLKEIVENGGASGEIQRVHKLAMDFREKIKAFPFLPVTNSMSNAITSLKTTNCSAYEIFETLKNEYGIWVCPNGGELASKIFRVGHIGSLMVEDNDVLIEALTDMRKRGFF